MRRRVLLRAIGSGSLVGIAGCAGTGNGSTPTATPTPPDREFPYTAQSPAENVRPRDLTVDNGTKQEYDVSITITDTGAGQTVLERSISLTGESEHTFEDIIGKTGTYRIKFELAVGTSKRYEWPIDDTHGGGHIAIQEGDSPTDPIVWFSITNL